MVYKVLITETHRMTVEIEANSPEEAKQRAEEVHEAGLLDMDDTNDREWSCESLGEYVCPKCGGQLIPNYDDIEDEDETGEDYYWYPDWLVCADCGCEA